MAENITVTVPLNLTAQQVAAQFWELDSEAQADFFAELDRIAGLDLCQQMAFVVRVIQRRADTGDRTAQHGFQTMLSHAQAFGESATDYRVWDAKGAIAELAKEPTP